MKILREEFNFLRSSVRGSIGRYLWQVVFLAFLLMAGPVNGQNQESAGLLESGDVLSVTILASGKHQQSLDLTISPQGTVNFPYLGPIGAAGRTLTQLTEEVTALLARDIFVNPQVMIGVKKQKTRPVVIAGAVRRPGKYYLESDTTLLLLIAMAGGVTGDQGEWAEIYRQAISEVEGQDIELLKGRKKAVKVNLSELLEQGAEESDVKIEPGDVVNIPLISRGVSTATKIFVLGKVQRPGAYDFSDGLTALDACVLAGGFERYAAPNRTIITRRKSDGGQEKITVDLDKVKTGDAADVRLRPGDRVFVPQSRF